MADRGLRSATSSTAAPDTPGVLPRDRRRSRRARPSVSRATTRRRWSGPPRRTCGSRRAGRVAAAAGRESEASRGRLAGLAELPHHSARDGRVIVAPTGCGRPPASTPAAARSRCTGTPAAGPTSTASRSGCPGRRLARRRHGGLRHTRPRGAPGVRHHRLDSRASYSEGGSRRVPPSGAVARDRPSAEWCRAADRSSRSPDVTQHQCPRAHRRGCAGSAVADLRRRAEKLACSGVGETPNRR